jgi:hypothetical protein
MFPNPKLRINNSATGATRFLNSILSATTGMECFYTFGS